MIVRHDQAHLMTLVCRDRNAVSHATALLQQRVGFFSDDNVYEDSDDERNIFESEGSLIF